MKDQEHLYFGGMSTDPDVKLINDKFPNPKPNDEIPYSKIEPIIGVSWRSSRFTTIINAWAKDLKERGIFISRIRGTAIRFLTNKELLAGTGEKISSANRKLRGHRKDLTMMRPKDDEEVKLRDHNARLCYNMEKSLKDSKKLVSLPNVVTLPQNLPDSKKVESS